MTRIVGIDPGVQSGVCVIDEKRVIVATWTVRLDDDLCDAAKDILAQAERIAETFGPDMAVIEDVRTGGAYRRQHPVSIAKLNCTTGMWIMAILRFMNAVELVSPQK